VLGGKILRAAKKISREGRRGGSVWKSDVVDILQTPEGAEL
jgi:hypothetical protein